MNEDEAGINLFPAQYMRDKPEYSKELSPGQDICWTEVRTKETEYL